MKGKAEIRFCTLGFLCLVVIAVAAMTLSETAKGIRLAEGNSAARESQTELVTAISGVSEMARPQVHMTTSAKLGQREFPVLLCSARMASCFGGRRLQNKAKLDRVKGKWYNKNEVIGMPEGKSAKKPKLLDKGDEES